VLDELCLTRSQLRRGGTVSGTIGKRQKRRHTRNLVQPLLPPPTSSSPQLWTPSESIRGRYRSRLAPTTAAAYTTCCKCALQNSTGHIDVGTAPPTAQAVSLCLTAQVRTTHFAWCELVPIPTTRLFRTQQGGADIGVAYSYRLTHEQANDTRLRPRRDWQSRLGSRPQFFHSRDAGILVWSRRPRPAISPPEEPPSR